MLRKLGIQRIAFDWMYRHLDALDTELSALKARKIAMSALWAPASLSPASDVHLDALFAFIERQKLRLPLWVTLIYPPDFYEWVDSKKLARTTEAMAWVAERAAGLGCTVSLYNFDGWFANPASQARIIAASGRGDMGIVYNFRYAHDDVADFEHQAAAMLPHLTAINLSGVRLDDRATVTFGNGDLEYDMLTALLEGGYRGPLGIASDDPKINAQEALSKCLDGLARFKRMTAARHVGSAAASHR